MKLLLDFLPILLFFAAYKFFGIYVATAVAMLASAILVAVVWYRHRKLDVMQLLTLVVIMLFGGATLILHDEWFIKWKPTVINWLFAVVFLLTQLINKKPLIQSLMEREIELPLTTWKRLNLSWVSFFVSMGLLNLYVIYHFSTDVWVDFKLFGMLGLTLLFIVLQTFYLSRYLMQHDQAKNSSKT